MTPERAHFHLLLLEAGERTLLDAELRAIQEADAPLTGLPLALSVCVNDAETRFALQDYLLDHPADPDAVEDMLRAEASRRYHQGRITLAEALALLRLNGPESRLSWEVTCAEEYAEMAAEGLVPQSAADKRLADLLPHTSFRIQN